VRLNYKLPVRKKLMQKLHYNLEAVKKTHSEVTLQAAGCNMKLIVKLNYKLQAVVGNSY
jgi:hypothetical protein